MVRIINNKSLVTGTVNKIQDDAGDRDFCLVDITVNNVQSLPGFPQLFNIPVGSQATLNMRKDAFPASFRIGEKVTFEVKASGPQSFFAEVS